MSDQKKKPNDWLTALTIVALCVAIGFGAGIGISVGIKLFLV